MTTGVPSGVISCPGRRIVTPVAGDGGLDRDGFRRMPHFRLERRRVREPGTVEDERQAQQQAEQCTGVFHPDVIIRRCRANGRGRALWSPAMLELRTVDRGQPAVELT